METEIIIGGIFLLGVIVGLVIINTLRDYLNQ